jgi:hypothetical protein
MMLLVLGLAACGPGVYDVQALATDDSPPVWARPLLSGGETIAYPVFYSDVEEWHVPLVAFTTPPDLAEVVIDGRYLRIRPPALPSSSVPAARQASGTLGVRVDGALIEVPITVAARATTRLVVSGVPYGEFPSRELPGQRLAVFQGDGMLVIAEHYTDDGERLLGHTDEAWSGEGVAMAEIPEPHHLGRDYALMRRVRPLGPGPASLAHAGATLAFDVVEPRTTARLELAWQSYQASSDRTVLRLRPGNFATLGVHAYAEDGRFIYGGPPYLPLVITSSDPAVIEVEDREATILRQQRLVARGVGTAVITVQFDGVTSELPVAVE